MNVVYNNWKTSNIMPISITGRRTLPLTQCRKKKNPFLSIVIFFINFMVLQSLNILVGVLFDPVVPSIMLKLVIVEKYWIDFYLKASKKLSETLLKQLS